MSHAATRPSRWLLCATGVAAVNFAWRLAFSATRPSDVPRRSKRCGAAPARTLCGGPQCRPNPATAPWCFSRAIGKRSVTERHKLSR